MSLEPELPPVGNETVDLLRALQLRANDITDPILKKAYIRTEIESVPSDDLFDQAFKVEAATLIGTLPARDRLRRFIFTTGMSFIGRAATYNYFINPREMIDFLTIGFEEPIVIEPEVAAGDFELFTFQVPVLAIDSFEETS